jgi:hypothetical protein
MKPVDRLLAAATSQHCSLVKLNSPRSLSVVFALGLTVALLPGCHSGGKVEGGPYVALGEMSAIATTDLLGGHGKLVLIVAEKDNKDTAVGKAIAAFTDRVTRKGITIATIEKVPVPAELLSGTEPLTAAQFLELLQKHIGADALVSFVGMPPLTPDQIAQLPAQRPKVVAPITYTPPAKVLFRQQLLYFAIVPTPTTPGAPPPKTTAEIFEAHFQFVSPRTADTLPN